MDYLYMDGGEVFKFAVKKVPQSILQTLEAANLTTEDIDWYLFHQANARITATIAKRLKVPNEKIPMNVDKCGNTSAASVAILLDEVNRKGLLKKGRQTDACRLWLRSDLGNHGNRVVYLNSCLSVFCLKFNIIRKRRILSGS